MVFFTCNHCGASVKKNKVEKHYGTQCKNFPSLSCMDCQKDFQGSEYEKHTKCITEDEKYSAKGFVPKPNGNKGEIKQQSWLEVIRSVKDLNHKFSKAEKCILDIIVNHENVPRKKNKFVNFLKTSFNNRYDPTAADNIWKMLEEQNQKSNGNQKQTNGTVENGSTETASNLSNNKIESGTVDTSTDSVSTKQRKSKKNCESEKGNNLGLSGEEVANDPTEAVENDGTIDQSTEVIGDSVSGKQKKKKSKRNSESEKEKNMEHNGGEVDNRSAESMENRCAMDQTTGKQKKKKSKKNSESEKEKNMEHNGGEVDNRSAESVENECAMDQSTGKQKKKKSKKNSESEKEKDMGYNGGDVANQSAESVENECAVDQSTDVIADSVSGKQKKKKSKKNSESEKENSLNHNGEEVSNEATETVVNGNTLSKKEKKEKRKREKYEATLKEIEQQQHSEIDPASEDSPKKRKKSKNDNETNVVIKENVADSKLSKKEKKRIGEDTADEPHSKKLKQEESSQNGAEDHTAPSQEKVDKYKFDWNRTILELVQTKGGEMQLKRLRKKVIAEYQNSTRSNEDQEVMTVKFNKRLMKVPGISINKEIVQLVN